MRTFFVFAVLVAVTGASLGADPELLRPLVRARRQLDLFGNTQKLIEELIENLRKAGKEAGDAVSTFNQGLAEQGRLLRERIQADMERLRDRVTETIQSLADRFTSSGNAVRNCIDSHRDEADVLYKETSEKIDACAEERLKEGSDLISGLSVISENANEFARVAFEEMRNCSAAHSGNFLSTGSCMAGVAVRTEMKGAVFLAQSGFEIARANLFMATLPASLEVCAGNGLVGAGVGTARIVMEVGSCSASSVFETLTGSDPATATAAVDSTASSAATSVPDTVASST